ncbi:MAG: imidazoleglycerol-phosphate dehydratase HisB [Firmicutes bacterium]|jgi:imidazoleglycerol-phosphate dehydratase|nr:imidazoleglycerol-phosphate dehydratase HisB [Bacillota bacterium]MBQ4410523.1 imidazoleglycerol-phosphate dehydratase HisB [Bacillota bacterium]MBQ6295405.1 imidazoleglycerol-phosphate dehydratase HisB [Bacillota bacterium]MBR0209471.1 imidazoleglycerol-phosphate dehydratase HisB [Bacillota bacterium]
MRKAEIKRKTAETDIVLTLDLDGTGKSDIDSGVGFLDHMLTLFAKHGRFDLQLACKGDTQVDDHHSVEDIGICLGEAFAKALGDKAGIRRYGSMLLPMDEALVLSSLDISGRAHLSYTASIRARKVGTFDTELAEEFWEAFVRSAKITLHIRQLAGRNAHHIIEGMFKSVARALREAVSIDPALAGEIPSTKGVL